MLSGLSFRSAFIFSINSLILSGFPLTSYHLAEANLVPRAISKNCKPLFRFPLIPKRCAGLKVELKSYYLFLRGFTLLCVQISKNITKCFLKKSSSLVLNQQSTYFTENVNKLWNNTRTVCEIKQKQKKLKPHHIQIDRTFYCLIQPTNNPVVSLKDGFTV